MKEVQEERSMSLLWKNGNFKRDCWQWKDKHETNKVTEMVELRHAVTRTQW